MRHIPVEILKQDPERYRKYLEKQNRRRKRRLENVKKDPERYEWHLKKQKECGNRRMDIIRNDPVLYQEWCSENREKSLNYYYDVIKTNPEKLKAVRDKQSEKYTQQKNDPAFIEKRRNYQKQPEVKKKINDRKKRQVFKRLCKYSNRQYPDNKLTPFDLWKIAKKQKLKCAFTGQPLTIHNMSVDHIIPKSKGGLNLPSNIRLVLKPVNIAKSNMSDTEFLELCKSIVNYSQTFTYITTFQTNVVK